MMGKAQGWETFLPHTERRTRIFFSVFQGTVVECNFYVHKRGVFQKLKH
jgi:hypothetical protein